MILTACAWDMMAVENVNEAIKNKACGCREL